MKTIRQIANEIGVSKQTIQKRISREPLCTQLLSCLSTKEGTKYIDETGENIIKSAFIHNKKSSLSIDMSIDKQKGYTHQMETVSDLISVLKAEIEVKNKQVSDQATLITNLSAALASAQEQAATAYQSLLVSQALHAETVKQLMSGEAPSDDVADEKIKTGKASNKAVSSKRGFFDFLKGKKKSD